jgi:hypothetical protein
MKLLSLKYFLIGFAHIVVYYAAFAVAAVDDGKGGYGGSWLYSLIGGNSLILVILLYCLAFIIAICLMQYIVKIHGRCKRLWLVMVGGLSVVAWGFADALFLPFFRTIERMSNGCVFGFYPLLFLLPGIFILTVLECLIIYAVNRKD